MPKKLRILAVRKLELLSAHGCRPRAVSVVLYCPAPLPERRGFACSYQIRGLGSQSMKMGRGDDSIQALIHTLAKIGIDLYKSSEAVDGLLSWHGDKNLGFPMFEAMKDFVPGPKDFLVL